jgi:pimeloyl-ACP methyl ester carboxylesterase
MPLLTDPGAHGGDPDDAFTVVAPSLPGFGFSGPVPAGGLTADAVAGLWHRLMGEGLGYPRYVAHGSDLGAGVTARLARAHPGAVAGIHLATPGLAPPPKPWSPAEQAHFAEVDAWTGEEGGYAHVHSTKPATLGAALYDSPAGLAAWIGEKITAWSSTSADGQPAFSRDLLLGTLTLYWATGDHRLVPAALLGLPACARHRAASRRTGAGAHRDHHLRRRTGPLPQTAPRTCRTLLPRHELGRARPRRSLPRRRRTAAARPGTARRLQGATVIRAAHRLGHRSRQAASVTVRDRRWTRRSAHRRRYGVR